MDHHVSTIKPRRIQNQNVIHRLERRRISSGKAGTHWHQVRVFHQNVFPNFTVVNVEKPPCFLRKFSPDGRYFIAFSSDQTSLEIYEYQGCQAAEDLLQGYEGEILSNGNDQRSVNIRGRLFERFFVLLHITNVAANGEHLNRECSLFTDDCRCVIVGSAAYLPDEPHPPFYEVTPEGTFIDVRTIGRFCYEDDLLTVSAVFPEVQRDSQTGMANPFRDPFINSLKHRLLVYLWRRAEQDGSAMAKRRFFQYFDQLRQLRMWKMQLLDENHLFIKYTSEDVVTLRVTDPSQLILPVTVRDCIKNCLLRPYQPSMASFFVVYNMVTTEVIAVFENTSDELLELFENFCDLFRNATLHSEVQFPCSASSNNFARQIQRRFKDTIVNAKYGGHTEAVRRLLGQLPISAQSYSGSPYLDLSLFSYDDKWVSVMERPKTCGDHPIRFYARDSGLLKFEIQAGLLGRPINHTVRRLVAFTFHPFEPFAISVQRTNAEYVVNFHMRHCCT
ncbi:DET1 homolog isoform X7 [Orcinus orca]|uniref:DET1 homolog isoform X6 n=1 Tax=Tursiops truncatus TaxID=9739 RepID=A0A2U4C7D6_TURTR|nr:DET1 homolog isoform X6 [Tursiops truncatus]XP_026938910.1 DET1 homolog isoform X6 [Lagenorhynchus obliquidens]XP_030734536.1 DET1 homolog isoform X6 [Globicephala melas]XP_049562982.1 DET1 homolog isoform X7 [Orcinus orca]